MNSFDFVAQSAEGMPVSGTLNSDSAASAQASMESLGLRVLSLQPASTPARAVRLGAADLQLFNEQLLQLADAGLPMEKGLALLAADMKTSPLKKAMQGLADDLAGGKPIDEAIEARRTQFPPIYSQLIDAGIRTSNLPGVLHSFGRHLETVERIKSELWRACAYPMVVLLAFAGLMIFLSYSVLPQYYEMISSFMRQPFDRRNPTREVLSVPIPTGAMILFILGRAMPLLLGGLLAAIFGVFGVWAVLRGSGREGKWLDTFVLRFPLVGRALRHSYITRWTDTLAIGVRAGLDLPRALELAGQVIAIPSLQADSAALVNQLQLGQPLDQTPALRRLPVSIPAAIELASRHGNLPDVLERMARQLEKQTEQRIRLIPATLLPALVILIGLCAGGVIYGLWAPLANMLKEMTGGW
ncbi:MAG: type II secretion system F family protein [Burkholderiales bacterium]|nr:type II secretion system F family protein [Phycisphaerae bacterium]